MEIESYCYECILSNILEKQGKFPPNESVHHVITFTCFLQT